MFKGICEEELAIYDRFDIRFSENLLAQTSFKIEKKAVPTLYVKVHGT